VATGNCGCCDRRDVPGSVVNCPGEPFDCFICQGDSYPDPYGETDDRVVPCEACGTEGELIHWTRSLDTYGNPLEHSTRCPWCEGTGGEVIKMQPITLEDLDQEQA
jgi:hypothetical protein